MIQQRNNIENDQRGFTFIEMLLVLFLFIIILIACSDIFLRSQRAQYQAQGMQRLQDDARYVINKISDDVRTGGIDYSCYSTARCDNATIDSDEGRKILALTNAQGRKKIVKIGMTIEEGCINTKSMPCMLISDDGGTWQSLTQDGVVLDAAKSRFVISPVNNPFELNANNVYLSNIQPHVTIYFEAIANIRGLKTPTHLGVQTTVTTREYKR